MYGKVFESIYDGTLAGHWQAIVTMQQLIVLANEDGVVDMTPDAIARRTSIPLDIIAAGLEHLAKPDPFTRTPGDDGKRIVLLDDHRPWGWRLVNHAKYRALRNLEQKREADRQRLAEKRKKIKSVATASRPVANVAHTDADTDANTKNGKDLVGLTPDPIPPAGSTKQLRAEAVKILGFLNEKTGRSYELVPENIDRIVARLKGGTSPDDVRAVIAMKCREWGKDEKMAKYLRPKTLFAAENFANYKGELLAHA